MQISPRINKQFKKVLQKKKKNIPNTNQFANGSPDLPHCPAEEPHGSAKAARHEEWSGFVCNSNTSFLPKASPYLTACSSLSLTSTCMFLTSPKPTNIRIKIPEFQQRQKNK